MTEPQAAALLSENLPAIYGYAYARLYDKDKAEDLASEIVLEVLQSAKNLKNEAAFWGFAWKIAENTFRKFLRREELIRQSTARLAPDVLSGLSAEHTVIEREEQDEQLHRLRRELSLLVKRDRAIYVAYYIDQKSCARIADEMHLSVDAVKYHLSHIRRRLKEGMNMERKLGEKSYNPGTFRLGFWGENNHYGDICNRKLPGAILLAAYRAPLLAQELAVELGVAMPYLEEELDTLEAAGLLRKTGNRYQTNVVILTDEYEKELADKTHGLYPPLAEECLHAVRAVLPQIRALDFFGNDFDENRLLFGLLNIAMVNAYALEPMSEPPKLPLGGRGWVFGEDNDFVNYRYYNITMETWNRAGTAWFSAENYRAIAACQLYDHANFDEKTECMCDAVLGRAAERDNQTLPWLIENGFVRCVDGRLAANFSVFERAVFEQVRALLRPVTERVADCMRMVSDRAEAMLRPRVPAAVKEQCGVIAKINFRLDVSARVMEWLIESKQLALPVEKTPLCVWGVKK